MKFQKFKPILFAILFFLSLEIIIYARIGKEKILSASLQNSLFDNKFKKFDVGQKYIYLYKQKIFKESKADFIQVGDSSGFFGVQPKIINAYLKGLEYVNLSCCSDAGWDGHLYTANYFLKNNPNAKYLVLYLTPYHLPSKNKNFSEDLKKMFGGSEDKDLFGFFKYIPSLYYRKGIIDFIYQSEIEDKSTEYKRVMNNLGVAKNFENITGYKSEKLIDYLEFSKGWLPYDRKEINFKNMNIEECGPGIINEFYGRYGNPTLKKYLQKFKIITEKYNAKLIVLFNPVACKPSYKVNPIIREINEFKLSNPDVYIPFDFINNLAKFEFSDPWHLTPDSSVKHSHKLGEELNKFLEKELIF